jgi:hypothetical protein
MNGQNGHQHTSFDKITAALHGHDRIVKPTGDYKAMAQCPGHEDRNPSLGLAWTGGDNPLTLMYCYAGCDTKDIMAALELRMSDLYDKAGMVTYNYANPDSGWAERFVLRDPETKKFTQSIKKKADKTPLYRRDLLRKARADNEIVYLVEGEKDADALIYLGHVATTAPQGATNFDKSDVSELAGLTIVAIADLDDAGRVWARQVCNHLGMQIRTRAPIFKRAAVGKVSDHIAAQLPLAELVDMPDGFPYEDNPPPGDEEEETPEDWSRVVDLRPYMDGTAERPQPTVGGLRDDAIHLLYPKRWHTCVGLTTAGKTTFALWHVKAVLESGGHIAYIHFEETDPGGVLDRLQGMGVDTETIYKQFHWFSSEKRWATGEMAYRIGQLEQPPDLAVLDGINAACSQHGWPHNDPSAIGDYRAMFITPLVKAGAAVLSLGHPPKGKDRQNEMHGFGSTAWLDEVDGVGFKLVPSKHPMVQGGKGYSALYVVKDRYSQVKRWGNVDTSKDQPWYYMGALVVDDSPERAALDNQAAPTEVRLNIPKADSEGHPQSREAVLADHIVETLQKRDGHSFGSVNKLKAMLAVDKVKYTAAHLPIALDILVDQGRLESPDGRVRPGRLVGLEFNPGGSE